jgi:hypothetical protein
MPGDLGGSMNELDSRLARLEQRSVTATMKNPGAYVNPSTGDTVVVDPLDWSMSAGNWTSYSTIGTVVTDPASPSYPGGKLSTNYAMAQVHMVSSMCVLAGMVRRTGAALSAGVRYNVPMFGLPLAWRPRHTVIVSCLMGNADPASAGTSAFGTAWVEIRPEINPVLQPSGRAYFVTGTISCSPGTGWIALQGLFPAQVMPG